MPIPLVIAHRGASSEALENSLEAVRIALAGQADMIEVDVRKSRDNGLFVMHDRMTGRTAERNIDLERASSDLLRKTKLTNGEPIPTLSALLDTIAGKSGLNLEIKSPGAGELTARQILSSGYPGRIVISSFHEDEVIAARMVLPSLTTAMIFNTFTLRKLTSYKARGFKFISLSSRTVNEKLNAACHQQGIQVYVWTVDEEEEMRKFISWGVDGIYSNKPKLLRELIRRSELGVRSKEAGGFNVQGSRNEF